MSDSPAPIRVAVAIATEGRPRAGAGETGTDPSGRPVITPPIDIHDGSDGLTLEADLPGATEANLSIQLEHNVLTLDARIPEPAAEGMRLIHREFPAGDFHRSFILSDDVDRERITAELDAGVLRIHLPKTDRPRARRVDIKS